MAIFGSFSWHKSNNFRSLCRSIIWVYLHRILQYTNDYRFILANLKKHSIATCILKDSIIFIGIQFNVFSHSCYQYISVCCNTFSFAFPDMFSQTGETTLSQSSVNTAHSSTVFRKEEAVLDSWTNLKVLPLIIMAIS